MAHCSSSLVHTPSFVAHRSAHNEKRQDLLPPRKRLLAGLKYVKATPSSSSSPPPPPPPPLHQSLHMEVHVDANHISPAPPYSLLLRSPTQRCLSCGDGGVLLHRVPCLAGSSSYHCSSCVLAINKTMYCVLCYQVIEVGSPSSSLLSCCRCQRLTHLDCALKIWSPSLEGAGLTLCRDCYTRNNGQLREPPIKKQKTGSARRSKEAVVSATKVKLPLVDIEALAAARIVAIMAKRRALETKQRAEFLAKAAACAAMHAKTALDNMYNLSQKETDVEGHFDGVASMAAKDEGGIAAPKTPKSLKRRALSAIVASEMLSKKAGTTANAMVLAQHSESKQMQTRLDTELAEATSSHDSVAKESSCFGTRRARLAVQRRKTLSSLGLQRPPPNTHKVATVKGSKLASKKAKKSNSLSKGKLGAIVSQVLASNKFLKSSVKAPSCKVRGAGLRGATLDDAAENGVEKNACATTLKIDYKLDESWPILRGTIFGTDTCKPSHHGF